MFVHFLLNTCMYLKSVLKMVQIRNFFSTAILIVCLTLIDTSSPKEIPKIKLAQFSGPTLQFVYCFSCGYRKLFDQYAEIVKEKYPDIVVLGDNYVPTSYRMYLAHFFGILKFFLILLLISGVNPFAKFGLETPGFYDWLLTNKIYACLIVYFLCNTLEGQFVSTGAFEISLNGVPVWSKLESDRLPSPAELFQIIDSNLQFSHTMRS